MIVQVFTENFINNSKGRGNEFCKVKASIYTEEDVLSIC